MKIARVPTWNTFRHKPLGRSIKAVHMYVDTTIQLNPGLAGVPDFHNFSANGLYDPDISGVGHQPMGFDQMIALFNHYTVTMSKIRVTFVNEDANYPQIVGVRIAASTSTPSDANQFIELTSGKWAVVGDFGSAQEQKTLTLECPVGSWLGRPNVLNEDDLRGDDSANPTEDVIFQIIAQPIQGVDSGRVDCVVQIEYTAIWTEPRLTAGS